ncbi:hypothetical protein P409_00490 [Inquilinus limosus MP06]|uniref:ParB/Sulfiredoxin domain-containing protein n=1 Tax=Inquilinus limosus MP06 TaxID=1398085 RepID=A0A0A0DBW5_9PROT|nr:hypothetical protein P409_00490 [Inquilinus limosus MP06]
MVNGWHQPIHVDVGVPSLGFTPRWPIEDGNHRLYAAKLRGDTHILVTISGSVDLAAELFGVTADVIIEQDP